MFFLRVELGFLRWISPDLGAIYTKTDEKRGKEDDVNTAIGSVMARGSFLYRF